MHEVAFFFLHGAKCCVVTGYDGLASINSGQEQEEVKGAVLTYTVLIVCVLEA